MAGEFTLEQRLNQLTEAGLVTVLSQLNHGIEKEGLRVEPRGGIAQTGHPKGLGSALTHDRITTDYSEALLEFITPVFEDVEAALAYLQDLHRFTYEQLPEETVWLASMPPKIKGEDDIPIARYGKSNIGQMKYIYRVGLANRYGKAMQTIAGIHYNFSLSESFWSGYQQMLGVEGSLQDFRSSQYFSLIRNFRRYSWLLIYLFGASPAVSRSFLTDKKTDGLERHGDKTLFGPYATSLRMSDLGYSNDAQSTLNICYNQLSTYANTLEGAISAPYPDYQKLGVKVDGEYRQLNANLLQIENEYYSDIRPKRVTQSGERPVKALQERGVEYVEVRNIDINPFLPVGIDNPQAHFLDCFLVLCLLKASPEINTAECNRIKRNHRAVVWNGRQPGLTLETPSGSKGMAAWGHELLDEMLEVAALLDQNAFTNKHRDAVLLQRAKLDDPELTPSAQVLAALQNGQSYDDFVLQQSQQLQQALMKQPLADTRRTELEAMTQASLQQQEQIESADKLTFDEYLQHYMA